MDTSGAAAVVAAPTKRSWRRHSDEFKARVIEMARQPNASVAAVALANGLNANMLRRWVREFEATGDARSDGPQQRDTAIPTFVQLPMCAQPSVAAESPTQAAASVVVEIQRNGATVRASLPLDSRSAAWLREVTG
ncbi:MAG: transposase [Pseudomonadota bacterium]